MRRGRIALCVDGPTASNPELIGLDGESLQSQPWLDVFVTGEEARKAISGNDDIGEAWVASSEDVDPINLAATLKADRPDLVVRLLAFERCGSLRSRAHTASIDEVLECSAFARCYADAKSRISKADDTGLAAGKPVAEEPVAVAVEKEGSDMRAVQAPLALPATGLQMARLSTATQSRGFVMPVVSGSGGAGKSTVAVVGAFIACAMGYRTLLLDYDLQFGDVAILAGAEGALGIDEALSRPDRLEQELALNRNPMVLAAPARLEAAEPMAHDLPRIVDELSGAFDVVIANTGAAWADYHAALLERSSAALFLVDQRASSLRACRHALDLCMRCGIATGPFQFAVNRCRKGASLSALDVSYALQGAQVHELEDGGPEVEECLGAGEPAELLRSGNAFCKSLERVLRQLLPNGSRRMELPEPQAAEPEKKQGRRRGRHGGRKRGWRS